MARWDGINWWGTGIFFTKFLIDDASEIDDMLKLMRGIINRKR